MNLCYLADVKDWSEFKFNFYFNLLHVSFELQVDWKENFEEIAYRDISYYIDRDFIFLGNIKAFKYFLRSWIYQNFKLTLVLLGKHF